jgi:hypothetical protein
MSIGASLGPCTNLDLPDTVSQCDKNLEMCADAAYGAVLTTAQEKHFMWRIIPRQAVWSALTGRTWKEVVRSDIASAAAGTAFERHVPACTRRISSVASTAFTILYALEHLNTSTAWTEKSELIINVRLPPAVCYFRRNGTHDHSDDHCVPIGFC